MAKSNKAGKKNKAPSGLNRALVDAANHRQGGRLQQATTLYERILAKYPRLPDALIGLAATALQQNDPEAAVTYLTRASQEIPDDVHVWGFLSIALNQAGRPEDAIAPLTKAARMAPDVAGIQADLGTLLSSTCRLEAAIKVLSSAVQLDPNNAAAHLSMGLSYSRLDNKTQAVASLKRALDLTPDDSTERDSILTALHHNFAASGDWSELATYQRDITRRLIMGTEQGIAPFRLLATPLDRSQLPSFNPDTDPKHFQSDPGLLLDNARRCNTNLTCAPSPWPPSPPKTQDAQGNSKPLVVGYLCGDFRSHPVATLVVDLFAHHDRQRVTPIGFSTLPPNPDPPAIRVRIEEALDDFHDVYKLGFVATAEAIRAAGVDVLVDLSGYTEDGRLAAVALRPAPVQISYLGYTATSGGAGLDYLIGDALATPLDQAAHFSEQLIHLPNSYMIQPRHRAVANVTPTRAEAGLPENAFVFCCFNNSYKILPATFDLWMSLLRDLPQSVLWLRNPKTADSLKQEAKSRGVDPERLVFAGYVPDNATHLARHRLADLFLDTLPFNAHSTCADALWAGLPVLTLTGNTFPGRVASSLISAAGLPELVTHNTADYLEMARHLATHPTALDDLKQRLREGRDQCALFDQAATVRHLEDAYYLAWQRHVDGLPPAPISV